MTSPNMTASTSDPLPPRSRGGSGPRPQARSAGTAERAGRNESLVDLVRFFQTQNMTAQPTAPPLSQPQPQPQPSSPSDTTTALPVAISPKESKPDLKQDLKPFHRRLLQFAQRPKKESSLKSKKEEQQRQLEALTREGYLIPASLPKELKGQKEAKQSKESLSLSVSRSLSKSKKDVENIGQPWLEAKVDCRKRPTEARRRLASLDLDDFGSMVDVAVSLTSDFDDSVPPPYQPTDTDPSGSRSSSKVPMSSSRADPSPLNVIESASSLASTSHSYRNASIDEQVQQPSSSTESKNLASQDTVSVSKPTSNASASANDTESQPRASCDNSRRDRSDQSSIRNVTPSQPTLKLFPDVAPPRKSSMAAWRTSAVPRYQTISNVAASPASSSQPGSSDNPTEFSDNSRKSSDVFTDVPSIEAGPKCSGALVPHAALAAAVSAEKAPKESASPDQIKARPTSLSMGTLKAFPLPAPMRPLPSLPELGRCPNAPPDTSGRSIRSVRSEPISSTLHSSSSAVPEGQEIEYVIDSPRMLDSRPATALGSVYTGGSMADDEESLFAPSISEYSKSTPGLCTPRGRASSIRIPRMQELPETPSQDKAPEGQPLADSPVLGHVAPTKTNGKGAVTGLQINSQVGRKNLPFGLPSPPPTASLPLAPPQHPPPAAPGRKIGQRNATAPHAAKLSSMKSMEVPAGPGSYRNSMISRSDSSRSSLRNESFPDSYEESRPESPLPSSDDEVFGPGEGSNPSRREPNKHKRVQTERREHQAVDANQTSSRTRLRYPQPSRSMIPQSHSNHDLAKTSFPQSQYPLSAHRLRESQNNHHPRAPPAQRDHYLEDRVANLERQNQMLQAALMAALNASGKNPLEGLNLDPNMTPAFPHAPYANQYPGRHFSRPDSWVSSSRSSDHSGFETSSSCKDGRANVKQLDNMIEDIESGWMSDKSSLSGARIARKR